MAADLKLGHVPAGVVMRGSAYDTELRLVARFGIDDIDRELDLQELHLLTPFNFRFHLNHARAIFGRSREADGRADPAVLADPRLGDHGYAMWTAFSYVRFGRVKLLSRV